MFSKRVVKEDLLETASNPELTERVRQDFGECSAQIRSNNRQGLPERCKNKPKTRQMITTK